MLMGVDCWSLSEADVFLASPLNVILLSITVQSPVVCLFVFLILVC